MDSQHSHYPICRDCRWLERYDIYEEPNTCRCPYCTINLQQIMRAQVKDINQTCKCGHFVISEGQET